MLVDIPAEYREMMIINLRWKMYCDFLEIYGDNYTQLFVTDVRDVIFQGDVFEAFKGQSSYLGYTTEATDIGASKASGGFNYNWLLRAFGQKEADKLTIKQAICCGTVIGTVNEVKIFSQTMWEALKKGIFWGYEQAQMNYLVYNNLLPIENLIEIDVHSGAIFTNGIIKDNKIRDDKILRGDGGVPAVVHQYDRHKELVQLVDRIYRDKNFQIDEQFSDARSNLDQVKQLLFFGRIDDAAQFFMKKFVDGANFDNNVNILMKLWEMLLNHPLAPAIGYLELSVQNALAITRNFPIQYLNAACSLLTYSIKNRRAVNPQLVNFITGGLYNIAEQSLSARNADFCFFCIDAIKSFDLPPNKDFYLLQAKANRTFGRKEEALAAYSKALELS